MRTALALSIASMLLLGWCQEDDLGVNLRTTQLPDTVELKPGQSVNLPEQGYLITFRSVPTDSRCPTGAQCVWAGDAAVHLKISGTEARDCTLHTTLNPKSIVLEKVSIGLKRVAPYPSMDSQIDSSDYRVKLALAEPTP